jgi:hypothetical protein
MRGWPFGVAVALSALAIPVPAGAQDECDGSGLRLFRPEEITPASGARGVTLDAPIVVRYSPGYFGPEGPGDPPEALLRVGRCPSPGCTARCTWSDAIPVEGRAEVIGDRLFFFAAGGLVPGARYLGVASGRDGPPIEFEFCTGATVDSMAPTKPRVIAIEPAENRPACPPGGYKVDVTIAPSSDDGPAGSVEYLLYLTRGRGVTAPQLRDRLRNLTPERVTLNLILAPDEAAEPVCVRVLAIDGVGRISEGSDEACVDPLNRVAFQPLCSASPGQGHRLAIAMALGSVVATLWWRRRVRHGADASRAPRFPRWTVRFRTHRTAGCIG